MVCASINRFYYMHWLFNQILFLVLAIPIIPLTFSHELPSLGIYWNSWRTLLLVYSAPSIISAIWLFFMCESPKFLYSKGRNIEALDVLRKIYRLNHLGSKKEFEVSFYIFLWIIDFFIISSTRLRLYYWLLIRNRCVAYFECRGHCEKYYRCNLLYRYNLSIAF